MFIFVLWKYGGEFYLKYFQINGPHDIGGEHNIDIHLTFIALTFGFISEYHLFWLCFYFWVSSVCDYVFIFDSNLSHIY